eukprot:8266713-Pyramimonas_sp.AAC.1
MVPTGSSSSSFLRERSRGGPRAPRVFTWDADIVFEETQGGEDIAADWRAVDQTPDEVEEEPIELVFSHRTCVDDAAKTFVSASGATQSHAQLSLKSLSHDTLLSEQLLTR